MKSRLLRRSPGPRRYLRPGLTVEDFFAALTAAGVRYVVLRWFETLPEVAPGEDIDLLVADSDVEQVARLLTPYQPFRPTQKIDLYSETGLSGTDFGGVPYLSKKLATRVLDRAVVMKEKYRVPSPVDHLDSLAFHAAYHKGEASGLPSTAASAAGGSGSPDHDYGSTLARLALATSRSLELTLEGVDRYLVDEGLQPASDTLDRFQARNGWLRRRLTEARGDIGVLAGLIVFAVREAAAEYPDEIARTIERHGFEIVDTFELDEEQRERIAEAMRGGNWGRGPFPMSGGRPSSLIVAYDYTFRPRPLADGQIVNGKSARAKAAVRDLISERLHESARFNPMHSTDNGWQAMESLRALGDPDLLARVTDRVEQIDRQMQFRWPVQTYLSVQGRRAHVAVVQHPEYGAVVAKVFRPGSKQYFDRELTARLELADLGPVPPLLGHGDNWILSPLYQDDRSHVRRRLPGSNEVQLTFPVVRQLSEFVEELRRRGFFLRDLATHNLVTDRSAGLRILDFEFLQRYPGALPPLERDYSAAGVVTDAEVDEPLYSQRLRWDDLVHKTVFHSAVSGLGIRSFLTLGPSSSLRVRMEAAQLGAYLLFAALMILRRGRRTRMGNALVTRMRRAVRR